MSPTRTHRRFTPARIVALVLIAAVAGALGLVRAARGGDDVALPSGARAGQLSLEPCRYDTEGGSLPAECGTLVVPEHRGDPRSRLIALPVTRVRARAARPAEPVFRLEGGPGRTNLDFAAASRFTARHDVVLVGYRGVEGSSRLDCPEVTSALRGSRDLLGAASLRAYAAAQRECARRLEADGVDLAGYSLPERAEDLEAARLAFGYGRIDLLSESAGTRTAMIYAWRHPDRVRRSVMIGVNPPGHYVWNPADTDAQLHRYAALCDRDRECRDRTGDLAAAMRHTAADLPDRWGPLRIKAGNVRLASFLGLMEATRAAAPLSAPTTLDAWRAAADGDASGLWAMSLLADLALPRMWVWGEAAAAGRIDAGVAARHFAAHGGRGTILGDPGNAFVWGGGRSLGAWPGGPDDDAWARVPRSEVPTLLIGGRLDGTTPARSATRELLPHLPNGHQVLLRGFGHTTDFWNTQRAAGTHLIERFLDTGQVDVSRYGPQPVRFTPSTSYAILAKGVAAGLAGLALVTALSLLWLPLRVRRRGRLGRRAGVALRTVGAAVLGLGGWCLAALVALTLLPRSPLDGELLTVLSVGLPVAVATFLGWHDRDRSRRAKAVGLLAALEGALLGASLGFSAADGALAVLTAIPGAVAGANLALLVRDVASAGAPRTPRSAEAPPLRQATPA
jgi:pimeloyl-ACP methyl ester carboxylesterase